jgi:hypothetical protein
MVLFRGKNAWAYLKILFSNERYFQLTSTLYAIFRVGLLLVYSTMLY